MPWQDLLGAGVSVAGNLIGQSRQNAYNERQVDKQWSRMLEQWNRENAYNTPSAQIARMKAAGLNPSMMYGEGASGMVPAASSPTPGVSRQSTNPLQTDPLTLSTIRLQESQADKNEADAKEALSRVPVHQHEVLSIQQSINESLQSIKESEARVESLDLGNFIKAIDLTYHDERVRAELDSIYSGILRNSVSNWKDYQDVQNAFESLAIMQYEAVTNRRNQSVNAYNAVTNRKEALSRIGLNEAEVNNYKTQWEALGVSFDEKGNVVLDSKGALATEKGERSRHTVVYQYISDYFGLLGKVLNGSVSKVIKK